MNFDELIKSLKGKLEEAETDNDDDAASDKLAYLELSIKHSKEEIALLENFKSKESKERLESVRRHLERLFFLKAIARTFND